MASTKTRDQLILALIRKLNTLQKYSAKKDGKYCYRWLTRHSVLKDTGFDLDILWHMPSGDRAFIDKSAAKRPVYQLGYSFGKIYN